MEAEKGNFHAETPQWNFRSEKFRSESSALKNFRSETPAMKSK